LFCPRLLETATAVKGRNFFAYADRVSWSHIRSFLGAFILFPGHKWSCFMDFVATHWVVLYGISL